MRVCSTKQVRTSTLCLLKMGKACTDVYPTLQLPRVPLVLNRVYIPFRKVVEVGYLIKVSTKWWWNLGGVRVLSLDDPGSNPG